MDDLKSIDSIKPDNNDNRKTSLHSKYFNKSLFAISHQRIMIFIGILVLLLIIIAIIFAFKVPPPHKIKQKNKNTITQEVSLSGNISVIPNMPVLLNDEENQKNRQLPEVRMPQTLSTSNETLLHNSIPSLSPDTLSPETIFTPQILTKFNNHSETNDTKVIINNKNTKITIKDSNTKHALIQTNDTLKLSEGHYFTLQLSSALQPETLNIYAKKQKLTHFQIYETKYNTQSRYILVSGKYATLNEAKSALAQLPDTIKINNPWIRPIHQLQQDLKN